jgi:hypothetical protein
MHRIYLDKQIYSHLFKQEKAEYVELLEKIYQHKADFLFTYSHALLLDLKNDKSDIKFKELDFIETIVEDNYLSYHSLEKQTSCYLAKPNIAFKDVNVEDEKIDFSSIFDTEIEGLTNENVQLLQTAKTLFSEPIFDLSLFNLDKVPNDISEKLSKVLPTEKASMNLYELMDYFMGLVPKIEADKTIYKGLRNITDKYLNNGRFTVDIDEIDFNENMKDSVLKKTFIEYVNSSLNPTGEKQISNYDFYTHAYFTLDLLGISKDGSNVKFRNLLNDGFHSYYGAFCDCVVSDDSGFLRKTKVLYKLLGIEAKVYNVEEFIAAFDYQIENKEKDFIDFYKCVNYSIENGEVLNTQKLENDNFTVTFKPLINFFGYFNRILVHMMNEKNYTSIYHESDNYSNFTFYHEYEFVVNRTVKHLGNDINNKGLYDWGLENQLIKEQKWEGRTWDFGIIKIIIEINSSSKKLVMWLIRNDEIENTIVTEKV